MVCGGLREKLRKVKKYNIKQQQQKKESGRLSAAQKERGTCEVGVANWEPREGYMRMKQR